MRAVKGTKDIFFPKDIFLWNRLEGRAKDIFHLYGFSEIRTPIFESTDLFTRTLGSETDVVSKEMYSFLDRKNRSISLRPEGTAPVVRAFLEHNLHHQSGSQKLFYIGPMFRYERPQSGRMRQFHQIGAECLGENSPSVDAEIVAMLIHFLKSLGISDLRLEINFLGNQSDRNVYKDLLRSSLKDKISQMCQNCVVRYKKNILRILDCKIDTCRAVIEGLPSISEVLSKKSSEHFSLICENLKLFDIPFVHNSSLVRGLDYYTGFVFETVSSCLGSQNVLAAGGRYDNLVSSLGGEPTPAIGFAIGMERLSLCLPSQSDDTLKRSGAYWIALDKDALKKTFELLKHLREALFSVEMAHDSVNKSLKSHFRLANKKNRRWVFILGSEEMKHKIVTIKDLSNSEEKQLEWKSILDWVNNQKDLKKV